MRYAIYGSLGIAQHVIDAIHKNTDAKIVIVVDEENQVGHEVQGYKVQNPTDLTTTSFDQIIVATMAYAAAINQIQTLGYTAEQICDEVFWEPFFLQLEPTTRCNFSCLNCSHKDIPKERKNRDLEIDQLNQILNQIPTLKRIQLQGLGEPLLNPNLESFLKIAHQKGINTSFTTNGTFLNENARSKLFPYLDKLVISLDTVEENLFRQLRRGGNWQKIRDNIKTLLTAKLKTAIVYNCVVSSQNITALEGILRFALETSPNEVHIQLAENWYIPEQPEFEAAHKQALKDTQKDGEIFAILSKWKNPLKDEGIKLTYTGTGKRKGSCWWPFFGMFLSVDGYATSCCIRMQPEIFNFGNIHEKNLKEIWYGEEYKNFRKTMFHNLPNRICDQCPL